MLTVKKRVIQTGEVSMRTNAICAISSLCILFSFLVLPAGAQYLEKSPEKMSPLQYISWAGIPPQLIELLKKSKLDKTYEPVYDEVNPFYLCGDFDGDKIRDYAILLRSKGKKTASSSKVAILRGNGKLHWLAKDLKGDYPRPAWYVFYKDEKIRNRRDINNAPPPRLVGDGFMVLRPESSSALIYWNGKKFQLYWQSD
ncbi:MAG: hypothetical protein ACYC9O_08280 [Candidatus Latescibacterota bacterium]